MKGQPKQTHINIYGRPLSIRMDATIVKLNGVPKGVHSIDYNAEGVLLFDNGKVSMGRAAVENRITINKFGAIHALVLLYPKQLAAFPELWTHIFSLPGVEVFDVHNFRG